MVVKRMFLVVGLTVMIMLTSERETWFKEPYWSIPEIRTLKDSPSSTSSARVPLTVDLPARSSNALSISSSVAGSFSANSLWSLSSMDSSGTEDIGWSSITFSYSMVDILSSVSNVV